MIGLFVPLLTAFSIQFFTPSLIFLCIPNKKTWFFSALTIIFILYSGLFLYRGSHSLEVLTYCAVFLPVVAAKYSAVLQNTKGHKKTARLLPIFGLFWPIILLAILSNDRVQDFREDTLKNREDAYTITKHVRVSGVDYDIPTGYFRSKGYTEAKSIYLNIMWPDFSPLPRSERYIFRKGQQEQIIRLTASAPMTMISLEKVAQMYKKTTHRTILAGHQFDLEFYDLFDRKEIGQGELHIGRDENDQIIAVLNCGDDYFTINGKPSKNNPSCTHYFNDRQLTYKITYAKLYLKDWKEIQQKTQALFKEFREQAKQKGLDKVQIPVNLVDPSISRQVPLP